MLLFKTKIGHLASLGRTDPGVFRQIGRKTNEIDSVIRYLVFIQLCS